MRRRKGSENENDGNEKEDNLLQNREEGETNSNACHFRKYVV